MVPSEEAKMTSRSRFALMTRSSAPPAAIVAKPASPDLARSLGAAVRPVERGVRCFPVAAIEAVRGDGQRARVVERVEVDAPGLGMGAGLVEALHPADPAEE